MTEEEMLERFHAIRIGAPNLVVRQLAVMTHALTVLSSDIEDCVDKAEVLRVYAIYTAKIHAAIKTLEKMPPDDWAAWSELSKAEVIPQLIDVYLNDD